MNTVAVLIPTYKPSNYIIDALSSVDSQILINASFKVYIGLNGHREPYESFINEALINFNFDYELIYIDVAGVSNARNVLIDASNEDFIVFIDDDDLISPSYLGDLLKVSSKDIMGISNIYNFVGDVSEKKINYIGKTFRKINAGETSKLKARKYYSSPWGKMLHRDIIANYRFDSKLTKGEDSLFMAQISPNIRSVNKTPDSTCYFVHERIGSVTRRKVSISHELKMLNYLLYQYFKMLFSREYEKSFILTRLTATAIKYLKLFKR